MNTRHDTIRHLMIAADIVLFITLIALLAILFLHKPAIPNLESDDYLLGGYYVRASNDSRLINELIPSYEGYYYGYVVKLNRTLVKINSDGFRDIEYPIEKGDNVYRIAVIGDSFTFGQGVELNQTYPKQLENILNSRRNSKRYEVMNFGVPGYNTFQEVQFLKNKVLKYKPDIVIIGYLSNDIIDENLFKNESSRMMLQIRNETGNDNITYNLEIQIQTLDAIEAEIMEKPFNKSWKHMEESLLELYNLSIANNFSVVIFMFPQVTGPLHDEQMQNLSNLCEKKGWLFIYPNKTYAEKKMGAMIVNQLDGHPNAEEYSIYAQEIYKNIKEHNLLQQ